MTTPSDDETPIEREDGPDATDVPQSDPDGRVDDENLDDAPDDVRSQTLPLDDEEKNITAP